MISQRTVSFTRLEAGGPEEDPPILDLGTHEAGVLEARGPEAGGLEARGLELGGPEAGV